MRAKLKTAEYRLEHDSIIELAAGNQNVLDYCEHWEGRVKAAEEREKRARLLLKLACSKAEVHMRTVDLPMWRERAEKSEQQLQLASRVVDDTNKRHKEAAEERDALRAAGDELARLVKEAIDNWCKAIGKSGAPGPGDDHNNVEENPGPETPDG